MSIQCTLQFFTVPTLFLFNQYLFISQSTISAKNLILVKKTSIEPFTTYLYFFSKSQSPMSRVETKSCLISYPILAYIIGFVPSIEPDIIHASTQVCPGLYRILRQCLYHHGLYNLCTMCMHKTSNKKLTNISFEIKFIHA